MTRRRIAVCGSTGSIGTQTLEVVAAQRDRFEVVALGASRSADLVVEQARVTGAAVVALSDPTAAEGVADRLPAGTELLVGTDAMVDSIDGADVVVNGVVGFAGLGVTMAALQQGKRLALANKESLIAAGPVVQEARATPGAELVPVDSEHGALHQCLRGAEAFSNRVQRLVLTASGGPFRGRSAESLASVTVEQALAHPTWSMGPKITVDSSTLMNKGLEVIEAHELYGPPAGERGFGVGLDAIDVVVHPQSIVHSMVEYSDGSTIAQLSMPDMRLPLGYALAYPDRLDAPFGPIDWAQVGRLDFEPPDHDAFPCLSLCFEAGRLGGSVPAWINAANEVAVQAFLDGSIRWIDIPRVLSTVLEGHDGAIPLTVHDVIDADESARRRAADVIAAW